MTDHLAAGDRVAVVGAGPVGIVCVRWLLHYGLRPILFEEAPEVGGVWRERGGLAWPSMTTNLSRQITHFFGLEMRSTSFFPTTAEVRQYLQEYAERFDLLRHTRLAHRVVRTTLLPDHKWSVRFRDRNTDVEDEELFDFLVVASGAYSKPYVPLCFERLLAASQDFEGSVYHSRDFPTLFPAGGAASELAGKNVLLVGGSYSAAEIMSELIGHEEPSLNAKRVFWLMRRPHWLLGKWLPYAAAGGKLLPGDLIDLRRTNRRNSTEHCEMTPEEWRASNERMERLCPEQSTLLGGKLHIDRQRYYSSPPRRLLTWNLELFRQNATAERLEVLREERLSRVGGRRAEFESGLIIDCDAIVFCTGFQFNVSDFMDPKVLSALEHDQSDERGVGVLYRCTFLPGFETLAFAGMHRGLRFYICELQARWIARVFSRRQPPPDPKADSIQNALDGERRLIATGHKSSASSSSEHTDPDDSIQFLHNDSVGFADDLAREISALPDGREMERLARDDPELHRCLTEGPILPAHFFIVGPDAAFRAAREEILRINKEIDEFLSK